MPDGAASICIDKWYNARKSDCMGCQPVFLSVVLHPVSGELHPAVSSQWQRTIQRHCSTGRHWSKQRPREGSEGVFLGKR